jgi:hypothetical protein
MIRYKSGFKHVLTEYHLFTLPRKYAYVHYVGNFIHISRCIVSIKPSYAWDGATGIPDWPLFMEPSLRHDVKYQLIRLGILPKAYRAIADIEWALDCIASGVWRPLAHSTAKVLKYVGGRAARPASERWEKIAGPTTHYEYPDHE